MKKAIIGKKLGMTQVFTPAGVVIPVTVVEAGPCAVVGVKTESKEGYNSVVLAFGETKENRVNKAELGQFKKAGVSLFFYYNLFLMIPPFEEIKRVWTCGLRSQVRTSGVDDTLYYVC